MGRARALCPHAGGIQHLTVVDSSPALLAATQEALEAETRGATPQGAAGTEGDREAALPGSIQFVASTPGELLPVDPQ